MLTQLDGMYNFNILLILPVLLILAGSIFKKPTLPVMMASTVLAGAEALISKHQPEKPAAGYCKRLQNFYADYSRF